MGGGVGTAAWPAASHWCVSRGWCRQLRFWLRVWSSQLGWRPWLAACPRGHSLRQNPREAGAVQKNHREDGRRGPQQLQDQGLEQERHVRGGLSPLHCARSPRSRHERPHSTDARTTRHRKADAESNKGQDSRTAGAEPDTDMDTRLRNQTDHDSWKLFELFSRPRECSPCLIMERASASRFLNQDWLKKRRRCQRASMVRLRAQRRPVPDQNPPQKRPAASGRATKKRPSSCMRSRDPVGRFFAEARTKRWRRPYPCCGQRRDRCRCNWGAVEARLDSSAWESMVGRVCQGELKYVVASVCVWVVWGGCVESVRVPKQ